MPYNQHMMQDADWIPDAGTLRALLDEATRAGRRVVAGAVIVNDAGMAFVQRRATTRRLFPGCWDIAGGHVEPGETLEAALAREIAEETGWRLRDIVALVDRSDWETGWEGHTGRPLGVVPDRRREFDFLVTVDGDLDHPRLEAGKVSEWRWLPLAELDLLRADPSPVNLTVAQIVERGLTRYHQLAAPPGPAVSNCGTPERRSGGGTR